MFINKKNRLVNRFSLNIFKELFLNAIKLDGED